MNKRKILITGSNGQVASDLVKFFSKYNTVYACYRGKKKKFEKNKNVQPISFDIKKKFLLKLKPEIIISSAVIHPFSKNKNYNDFMETNVIGNINLISFANSIKAKLLINLSSFSVYGDIKDNFVDENTKINDQDDLGFTKHLAEKLFESQKINYINLRLPGVLSYRKDSQRPWLKKIINRIKNNKSTEVYNPNKYFNNVIDTKELYRFINFLIYKNKKRSGTYVLAASKPAKLGSIVRYIKNFYNSKSKISLKKSRKKSFFIKINKINKLGYKSEKTLKIIKRFLKEQHVN